MMRKSVLALANTNCSQRAFNQRYALRAGRSLATIARVEVRTGIEAARGTFDMHCIDEDDCRVVVEEVFDDAVNGYFGKGSGLELPGPGAVIVDAGANIGAFSVYMSRILPDCKIFAFEPIPQQYQALQANFELHGIQGQAVNAGLSKEDGEITFTFFPNFGRCSTYRPEDKQKANIEPMLVPSTWCHLHRDTQPDVVAQIEALPYEQQVARVKAIVDQQFLEEEVNCKLTSLTKYAGTAGIEKIDFLKIDVEGAELDVLEGIDDATWAKVDQFSCEVHDFDNRLKNIETMLSAHGFQSVVSRGIETNFNELGFNHHMVYAKK